MTMCTRAVLTDFLFMVFTVELVNLPLFLSKFAYAQCIRYFPQDVKYVDVL